MNWNGHAGVHPIKWVITELVIVLPAVNALNLLPQGDSSSLPLHLCWRMEWGELQALGTQEGWAGLQPQWPLVLVLSKPCHLCGLFNQSSSSTSSGPTAFPIHPGTPVEIKIWIMVLTILVPIQFWKSLLLV